MGFNPTLGSAFYVLLQMLQNLLFCNPMFHVNSPESLLSLCIASEVTGRILSLLQWSVVHCYYRFIYSGK